MSGLKDIRIEMYSTCLIIITSWHEVIVFKLTTMADILSGCVIEKTLTLPAKTKLIFGMVFWTFKEFIFKGNITCGDEHEKYTHHPSTIHSNKANMKGWMIMMAKWYSGTLWAWSFLTIVLQVRKNPEKTSPRKLVPAANRTRARYGTGAHATAWSTAVD